MTHQLNLDLSDEVYQPLAEKAQAMGQSVEKVASEFLTDFVQRLALGSRLRRWAGAVDPGLTDVATRHHDYLGESLRDELLGP